MAITPLLTREPIYQAIFNLAAASAGYKTKSRKWRHWNDVAPADQPALFQVQTGETRLNVRRYHPTPYRLSVDIVIYAQQDDQAATPAAVLNPLLDALQAAVAPSAASALQTLGGLVQHAWIEGTIEIFEGNLANQAVAIVPILMDVPAY